MMIPAAPPFRSVVFFRSRPPITPRTKRRRARREHNPLDPGNARRFDQSRRTDDVHAMHRATIARRKRVERRTMHDIAASIQRPRPRADIFKIAFEKLDAPLDRLGVLRYLRMTRTH